jgi:hypothetical protein
MNENNFFYIRYVYKGDTINKRLLYSNDTLTIEKKSLLTVDGKPIPNPEISLMEIFYLQKGETTKRVLINSFDPVFLNEDDLKSEVNIILESMQKKDKSAKIDEIISYISEMYGKPNRENITEWLEKNIRF